MNGKSAQVVLDDHFWKFAEREVSEGHYDSTSDVIRAGLKLLESERLKLEALRAALIEGEESGPAEDFDFDSWLEQRFPDIK